MRISVARRDGIVQATGSREDVVDLILLVSKGLPRWTVCGYNGGVSFCWPLGAEEEK